MSAAVVLGGAAAALTAFLFFGGKKGGGEAPPRDEPRGEGSVRPPWLLPIWVPSGPNGDDRIREEICKQTDPNAVVLSPVLAADVWRVLWQGVPWPPLPGDHASVGQARQILDALIAEYLANPIAFCERYEPAFPDEDAAPFDEDAAPPPDDVPPVGPTPIDISQYEDPYPNDGYMYQVVKHDLLGGTYSTRSIAYRALLSAGVKAAKELLGLDDQAAGAFALTLAKNAAARAIYIRMMTCDIYNDLYVTTEGYDKEINTGGPHGRGIRLLSIHGDDRSRLAQGLTPLRVVNIETGVGVQGGKLPYVHLPLLDPKKLIDTNLSIDARIVPGRYADGSTGMRPPPAINAVLSTAVVPKGVYGCPPHTLTV